MAPDTLSISKELRAAGFSEEQADVLATHMASRSDDLVTKKDLELAVSQLETRLPLKLGAGMAAGFALTLTGLGIILTQLG
jgi:hypothetical protein